MKQITLEHISLADKDADFMYWVKGNESVPARVSRKIFGSRYMPLKCGKNKFKRFFIKSPALLINFYAINYHRFPAYWRQLKDQVESLVYYIVLKISYYCTIVIFPLCFKISFARIEPVV